MGLGARQARATIQTPSGTWPTTNPAQTVVFKARRLRTIQKAIWNGGQIDNYENLGPSHREGLGQGVQKGGYYGDLVD